MMPMLVKFFLEKMRQEEEKKAMMELKLACWFFYTELSTLASLRWHWTRNLKGQGLCAYMGQGKQGNKCKDSKPERSSGV